MTYAVLSLPFDIAAAASLQIVAAATETPAPGPTPMVGGIALFLVTAFMWWLARWDLRQQRTDVSTARLGGTRWFWERRAPRQRLVLMPRLARIDVRRPPLSRDLNTVDTGLQSRREPSK